MEKATADDRLDVVVEFNAESKLPPMCAARGLRFQEAEEKWPDHSSDREA